MPQSLTPRAQQFLRHLRALAAESMEVPPAPQGGQRTLAEVELCRHDLIEIHDGMIRLSVRGAQYDV